MHATTRTDRGTPGRRIRRAPRPQRFTAPAGVLDGGAPSGRGLLRSGKAVRWRSGALVAVAGGMVLLAGCGGPAPAAAPPAAGAPPAAAANPNAPEINAAGDIPDNQVFVVFSPPQGGFTVSVPQGWAQSGQGHATVFSDKYNSVRVESLPVPAAPDVASAKATEVPALQAANPGFVLDTVSTVRRQAGQAVLITYQASSAPNPVTGKAVTEAVQRYEFWRAGREVALTVSAPQGADNVDPWRKITDSLRWQ